MAFTKLHTPKGTRDYLPDEVERYRYIEDGLREIFKLWGYQEVRSPTIEFVEALSTGVGPEIVDTMFKFQDFDGKILALRAEMTAPVARIATTRMTTVPEPIRLFYVSNVFRYSQSYVERGREFWQAGVELIGCNTSEADGEILSLLISSLRKVGLKEVRVDVGHASLLKDLLKATALDEEKRDTLQDLLAYRDEARLEKFMDQNNFPSKLRETFLQLSCCRRLGEVSSISLGSLEYAKADDPLRTLLDIKDVLVDYGIENLVFFDFSLTRKIEYYTGIVFEASVPNLGLPLGGGGRYDDFIEKFGKLKLPATGFALEIEKCLQALTAQVSQIPEKAKAKILVSSKFRNAAIKAVSILRDAGVVALLDVTKNDRKKTVEYAKLAGIDYVVFVSSPLEKPATVYDLRSGVSRNVMIETFLQRVGGQS
ncbi:MAG: ATP phosphoribosyltransferase regulatory subunit [Candidatus Bathyarchaeota archaeon]|nr:ATP phosphoribosyltransferase regulatory subunit [Candidatus Bathyarchaeota archaeon]